VRPFSENQKQKFSISVLFFRNEVMKGHRLRTELFFAFGHYLLAFLEQPVILTVGQMTCPGG
jgi:hypothetical protein